MFPFFYWTLTDGVFIYMLIAYLLPIIFYMLSPMIAEAMSVGSLLYWYEWSFNTVLKNIRSQGLKMVA